MSARSTMSARYVSKTNDVTLSSDSETEFLHATCRRYLGLYLRRGISRTTSWRSPEVVRQVYDRERVQYVGHGVDVSWDDLLFDAHAGHDFVLVNDAIVWDTFRVPRAHNLSRLKEPVERFVDRGDTVIEVGCGTGRNLLYLKRLFPGIRFVGLELSPVSAEVARAFATRFGIEVEYYECDVTGDWPSAATGQKTPLVYSCHALEQMPRVFPIAVRRIAAVASTCLLFLEPVPELWTWSRRGLVSRLRVRALDRRCRQS